MALTKSRSAITQLTSSGTSTTLNVGSSYSHTCYVKQVNGSATITVGAIAIVQAQTNGGSDWFEVGRFQGSTTASTTLTKSFPIPDDAASVRILYTAPTGGSSHTLDAEVGTVTSLT